MKRVSSGASQADLQGKLKDFGLRRPTYWVADLTFQIPSDADPAELQAFIDGVDANPADIASECSPVSARQFRR